MSFTQNGDKFIYAIKVENESSYTDTNVVTVIDPLPAGIAYDSHVCNLGMYNPTTRTWTIQSLPGKSETYLFLKVTVTNILNAPFTIEYTATGTLSDADPGNNTTTLTASASECSPAGGGNADTGCACIDVSANDTKCTVGTTEWRLNELSVVNGVVVSWDELTGKAIFTHTDPTLPITGTYDLWCVQGVDEYQVSCNVAFTITPTIEDKDVFDHTISTVEFVDLSLADIAVLTAQYPALTLADYCWRVLRNADGDATSGEPVDCNPAADTRFIHICSEEDCEEIPCPSCPPGILPADVVLLLPEGYEPSEGDVVYVTHPGAVSIYTFDGEVWVRSCGCISLGEGETNTVSNIGTGDGEVYKQKTGANFELRTLVAGDNITITTNANDITIDATLDPGDGDGWGDDVIHHALGSNSTGDGTVGDPLIVTPTAMAVTDTSDINLTLTGDGVMTPFTLSGVVNEGDPLPVYDSGTVGTTANSVALSTLFADTCPTGFTTPTYAVVSYPTDVYENVGIIGANLIYDIKATAPPGTHYINVSRSCA